jgi:hypothetical protein
VQLTHEELEWLNKMLGKRNFFNGGCRFDQSGVKMIEFHVDNHEELQKIADKKHPEFGTNVRSDPGEKANHYFWATQNNLQSEFIK